MRLVDAPPVVGPPSTRRVSNRPEATGTLIERWLRWRDHRLADPAFRRFAARFVPTRWLARRRAQQLFDLVAGFAYSQVLTACVRLDLFALLLERPLTGAEIARHVALDEDAAMRLLAAAVSLRLLERRGDDRFGLGPLGAPLAGDRAIASMVEHHAAFYTDLADPVALLRRSTSTRLNDIWGYAGATSEAPLGDARVAAYSTLMTASQPLVADLVIDACRLQRHRRLLDVGGGEGAFVAAVARRHPSLAVELFDLPAVAERARTRLAGLGLRQVAVHGGDFLRDPLPVGADVITLVRVIHDHDDDQALAILRAAHAALPRGGALILAEPMAGTRGAEAMGDAYFGMYLLAMGSGRPRTPDRLRELLRAAGFARVRAVPTAVPLQVRVLCATKQGGAPPTASQHPASDKSARNV